MSAQTRITAYFMRPQQPSDSVVALSTELSKTIPASPNSACASLNNVPIVISRSASELRKLGYASFDSWKFANPSKHVYIGRGGFGEAGSKWANPFTVEKHGRNEALRLYEAHVRQSVLLQQIGELEGCTLACWCRTKSMSQQVQEVCHGDVLVRLWCEACKI